MPRLHFDQQLRNLQDDLLRLANLAETALRLAVHALMHQDVEEARRVIADDDVIDRRQYDLEDKALSLLARQTPLATDLRFISAVIAIASELERMGDYAEGIAEITIRGANEPLLAQVSEIPPMAEQAHRMLRESVDAFVNRDVVAARKVAEMDTSVDSMTTKIQNLLLGEMLRDPKNIERALHLVFVAHNLERVADRATNISERIVFLVTGQIVELNT
ncbi:MAG: phosphate signaling complex protein PhoU [Herpetosiphon sp.]